MRKNGKIRLLLALGSVLGLGVAGTWATFSDDASFTTTIETGNVDISLDNNQQGPLATPYAVSSLSELNAKAGEVKYGAVKINNDGSLDFTYDVSNVDVSSSTDMDSAIALEAKTVTDTTNCSATGWASGTAVAGSFTKFSDLTGMTARQLVAGASEILCFKWTLDADAANSLQGESFKPIITFLAEQS